MTPHFLMVMGGTIGLVGIFASLIVPDAGVLAFAGGALFGKGYGVWEVLNCKNREDICE